MRAQVKPTVRPFSEYQVVVGEKGLVMNKLPPFHLGNPVPPELYVNRLYELDTIIRTLTLFRRHILVSGPRRIGKTSTLRKVYTILQETDEGVNDKLK